MAFLDNSGDIILHTVLTDLGRKRMAEGKFNIVKFALGDDEINYSLYNGSHASGSAYYDLEILQTPVLEPVTDNFSGLKSKLITVANPNLLYLPVLKLNTTDPNTKASTTSDSLGSGSHVVAVDSDTVESTAFGSGVNAGYMDGFNGSVTLKRGIRIDHGLDTSELSAEFSLQPDLRETQYLIEMDNRFLYLYDVELGKNQATQPISIDDDQIATYFLSQNLGSYIKDSVLGALGQGKPATAAFESIQGPRGTRLKFGLLSSTETQSSDYLFTLVGSSVTVGSESFYYIDTVVRVTGVNTGYRIDIPVRLVKKV